MSVGYFYLNVIIYFVYNTNKSQKKHTIQHLQNKIEMINVCLVQNLVGKKGTFDDVWIVSAATQSTVIGLFNVIIYNNVIIFHVIICKYKDSTAMPE